MPRVNADPEIARRMVEDSVGLGINPLVGIAPVIPKSAVNLSSRFSSLRPTIEKLVKAANTKASRATGPEALNVRIDSLKFVAGHPSFQGHQLTFLKQAVDEGLMAKEEAFSKIEEIAGNLEWARSLMGKKP